MQHKSRCTVVGMRRKRRGRLDDQSRMNPGKRFCQCETTQFTLLLHTYQALDLCWIPTPQDRSGKKIVLHRHTNPQGRSDINCVLREQPVGVQEPVRSVTQIGELKQTGRHQGTEPLGAGGCGAGVVALGDVGGEGGECGGPGGMRWWGHNRY